MAGIVSKSAQIWNICIYAGILRDKTMENKLMYITCDYKQRYHSCKLKLLVEKFGLYYFGKLDLTNHNLIKEPKVF